MFSRKLYPPPPEQIPTHQFPHDRSTIHPHHNRDRPLLPLPIPIQRNWNRAKPRAHARPETHPIHLVHRQLQTGYAQPGRCVKAMDVEEVRCGKEGEVEGQEESVGVVGGEGCAEED